MGALLGLFIRAAAWFGAGVGVTSMIDKFIPDKLPAGTAPLTNINGTDGKINWIKVGIIIIAGAIGIMLVRFVGKKFNVSILK